MATPVPYTGAPTVAPQVDPTSPVHIDAPPAAFGGAVAGALQQLGKAQEGAGQELFSRAYAMQEMNEHAKANSQLAAYQDDLVKQQSDFAQYSGQDAQKHLPDFIQQTEALRAKYSEGLSSPYAKQMFDDESRSSRFRVIFSAGGQAREQMKAFDKESANLALAGQGHILANTDPFDDKAVSDTLTKAYGIAKDQAIKASFSENSPGYDEFIRQHISTVLRPSLDTMLKTDSVRGAEALEKWHKEGHLSDDDYRVYRPRFDEVIQTKGVIKAGAELDAGKFNPGGAGKLPPTRVMDILPKVSGTGGYETVGREDPNGNGHAVGMYGLSSADLPMRLRNAGMPPMIEEEFLKDHNAQDQLAKSFFADSQNKYGNFNEALTAWTGGIETDKRVASAQKEVAQTASHSERSAMADEVAKKLNLDDIATDRLHQHVSRIQTQRQEDLARDNFDNGNIVSDALIGVGSKTGKVPTSPEELFAIPGVEDAFNKLKPAQKTSVEKALVRNIERGGYTDTVENMKLYQELRGIYYSGTATSEDRQKLIDLDPTTLQMPIDKVKEIQNLRKKIYDGAAADPNMTTAMQVMKPILDSMQIGKDWNPQTYHQFVGAFQAALKGETTKELQPVKDADTIRKVGLTILQPNPNISPGFFGGVTPLYQSAGDSTAKAKAEQALRKEWAKNGIRRDPTEDEVNQYLLRFQFQSVGNGKATGNKSPARIPQGQ